MTFVTSERRALDDQPSSLWNPDRTPTSHEQFAGRPWDDSYVSGPPPWDIGHPQPEVVRLADTGCFVGAVLDVGCGTGENALHLASRGASVVGVDVAETALSLARAKSDDQKIDADFVFADALRLEPLGRVFDTVLDCGLFHSFSVNERTTYVVSLASVTNIAGTLYVLCFSDEGVDLGPHPVSRAELRAAFSSGSGWEVMSIEPARLETRMHEHGASAWLATVIRTENLT